MFAYLIMIFHTCASDIFKDLDFEMNVAARFLGKKLLSSLVYLGGYTVSEEKYKMFSHPLKSHHSLKVTESAQSKSMVNASIRPEKQKKYG